MKLSYQSTIIQNGEYFLNLKPIIKGEKEELMLRSVFCIYYTYFQSSYETGLVKSHRTSACTINTKQTNFTRVPCQTTLSGMFYQE